MAAREAETLLAELGLADRGPPELFRSATEVAGAPVNGYSHVLRRAWKDFDPLLGVLNVGARPTVYLQSQPDDGPISRPDQRRFWSNGVAPILVRVTPQEVRVYSGLRPPAIADGNVDDDNRLIELFEGTSRALEFREFVRTVEAGTVYDRYVKNFDPTEGVDQHLVRNLRAAREQMSAGESAPSLPSIHRLLGRVLFTCYLEARGALLGRDFGRLGAGAKSTFREILSLPEPETVRNALNGLFRRLARYFRGDLFGDEVAQDLRSIRDRDVHTLCKLITARNELASGQLVLPFDVYDFSVIPIETISAVYEDFIRAEDPRAQRAKGAYYTPPKLVEFTTDLATKTEPDLTSKRVLDPGCGSGAFLVSLFNRMGEAWVRKNERARNGTRAQAMARILRDRICGVDVELIACQATCFSLYMAMLDFLAPREIRRLGPQRLPSLLLTGAVAPRQNGPQTVIHGDFLCSLPALRSQNFDLIVGNPPWVARGRLEKKAIAQWEVQHPAAEFPIPARQLACAFLWEVPRYLKPEGRACLLIPAKVLLGDQTDAFQTRWFSQHRVEAIAQLSDLRFYLFPGSHHPTAAIRFAGGVPALAARVDFLTPKTSRALLYDNVVAIEPDDRQSLAQKEILSSAAKGEAAVHWLGHNWASLRDREFLSRLRELPALHELVGEPTERKRWIKGQGFQPKGEKEKLKRPKEPLWKDTLPFLAATRWFDLLLVPGADDSTNVDPSITVLRRAPDERLFRSPLVIFNKGFSKIAYSPFDVIFQDALQAISGPDSDRDLLMFLTATLLSPLAQYFTFHLSSKAFYRYPFLTEVLRMPFPLPQEAPGSDAEGSVRAVAEIFDDVRRDRRFAGDGRAQFINEAKRELTRHVHSYFDVNSDEEILIEDATTTLQRSATPSRGSDVPTLARPTPADRERYASTLIRTLHSWAGSAERNLSAKCILSEKVGVAVLTVAKARDPASYAESMGSDDFDQVLSRLKALSPERYGSLMYLRNVTVLDRDRMHIVKPLTMRFWLRSAALNDADSIAVRLLNLKPAGVRG